MKRYNNIYKNKYNKYSQKILNLNGGLVCNPKMRDDIIKETDELFKFEGDLENGFSKSEDEIFLIRDTISNESLLLGEGGYGKVYKGILAQKISNISIKLKKDYQYNNILTELASIMNLKHKNIINYYGYSEFTIPKPQNQTIAQIHNAEDEMPKVVLFTEKIDGEKLYSCMKSLSNEKKIIIAEQLINGLRYMHSKNVFHKNISPESIIIENSNNENINAKYINFDYSCIDRSTCNNSRLTDINMKYFSPELAKNIIQNKNYNNLYKSYDLWALGKVLFELFFDQDLLVINANRIYNNIKNPKEIEKKTFSLENIKNMNQDTIEDIIIEYQDTIPEFIIENIESLLKVNDKERSFIESEKDNQKNTLTQQLPVNHDTIVNLFKYRKFSESNIFYKDDKNSRYIISSSTNIIFNDEEKIISGKISKFKSYVAIKEFKNSNDNDIRMLCDELTSVKELKHPNIVEYYGYAELSNEQKRQKTSGTPIDTIEKNFVVFMEFLNGKNLFDHIDLLSYEQKISIAEQLINGLKYMHDNKVYHRDIKPENIMLILPESDNVVVKYIDFGFSCKESISCEHSQYSIATKSYISPEFAKNIIENNEDRNLYKYYDLWALGIVLFEIFFKNDFDLFDGYIKYKMQSENKEYMDILSTMTQEIVDNITNNFISRFSDEIPPPQILNNIKSLLMVDYKQRKLM
jgi:serine/threonine protein kinase